MSEYMWARIEIGGTVSHSQLIRLTEEFGVLPLPAHLGESDVEAVHSLELENSEARWGQFEGLEDYLVEQAIAFDRISDGKYEQGPEMRQFRPGIAAHSQLDRTFLCDHDNRPMVAASDIAKALAETEARDELVVRLAELCGLDIPSLPPLNLVETT